MKNCIFEIVKVWFLLVGVLGLPLMRLWAEAIATKPDERYVTTIALFIITLLAWIDFVIVFWVAMDTTSERIDYYKKYGY